MSRRLAPWLLALATCTAGCSDLVAAGDNGLVVLEVILPPTLQVGVGDSVRFRAVGRNLAGDSVDAPVTWATPDTTIVVRPATGWVIGRTAGRTGRVQARSGELVSDFFTVTVLVSPGP
ncbi:MAG: hypothetical protein ACOY71_10515 [Gemmatimonadota bacterium]